jgi:3D (Asp-Asp-Asp) domain-containing protein
MRSRNIGFVITWLKRHVNWAYFLGPKCIALYIIAGGALCVWMVSRGERAHARELIPLSRPWFGKSDNRADIVDSIEIETDRESVSDSIVAADEQLVAMLREPVLNEQSVSHQDQQDEKWVAVRMRVTGYCACRKCCGSFSDGYTANMHRIRSGDVFIAADKKFRFGTQMSIPGYNGGQPVKVLDRGRVIKGNRVDLFFHSHAEAKRWGTKYLNVRVKVS